MSFKDSKHLQVFVAHYKHRYTLQIITYSDIWDFALIFIFIVHIRRLMLHHLTWVYINTNPGFCEANN